MFFSNIRKAHFWSHFATKCLKTPSPASKSCATSSKKKRNSSLPMTPSWHCIDLEGYKVFLFMCRPLSYVLWKKKASCLGWMIYRSVWTKHIQKSTCNFLMKSAIHCQFTWVRRFPLSEVCCVAERCRDFLACSSHSYWHWTGVKEIRVASTFRSLVNKSDVVQDMYRPHVSNTSPQILCKQLWQHRVMASCMKAQVAPRLCQAFGRYPAGKPKGTSGQVTL